MLYKECRRVIVLSVGSGILQIFDCEYVDLGFDQSFGSGRDA